MSHDSPPSPEALLQLVTSSQAAQTVHIGAQLGLADGPRHIEDLADTTGTHAPSLARLLRMLAALGVVTREADGRIGLTPLGAPLRTGVPGSVRDSVLFLGGEWAWRSWGELLYSLRTGKPAFDHVFGMSNFAYWEHNREAGATAVAAAWVDLTMLLLTPGGRERTESEFCRLLADAGFELRRVIPTQSPLSYLEAAPG